RSRRALRAARRAREAPAHRRSPPPAARHRSRRRRAPAGRCGRDAPPRPGRAIPRRASPQASLRPMPGQTIAWTPARDGAGDAFGDIRYEKSSPPHEGVAKITIARPEVRNAFRPRTIVEISRALEDAREDTSVGVIVLTGEGPDAFCSGGDQRVRGDSGYLSDDDLPGARAGVGRFHVTD